MRDSPSLQNTFKHCVLIQLFLIFDLQCSNSFITRKVIKISTESGPNRTSYLGYLEKQNCKFSKGIFHFFAEVPLISLLIKIESQFYRKFRNKNGKLNFLRYSSQNTLTLKLNRYAYFLCGFDAPWEWVCCNIAFLSSFLCAKAINICFEPIKFPFKAKIA